MILPVVNTCRKYSKDVKKHHKHHIVFFGGGAGLGTIIGIGTTLNTLLIQASQACTQLIESIF